MANFLDEFATSVRGEKARFKPTPIVGKTYFTYDDGKIKPTRETVTTIVDILDYSKLDDELKREIDREVEDSNFLYMPEQTVIVKAMNQHTNDVEYYMRTRGGGWFSSDFSLDVFGWYKEISSDIECGCAHVQELWTSYESFIGLYNTDMDFASTVSKLLNLSLYELENDVFSHVKFVDQYIEEYIEILKQRERLLKSYGS